MEYPSGGPPLPMMPVPTLPMRINVSGSELTTADPVSSYWSFLASRMSEGHAATACSLISSDLIENELCITIGCMLALPYHTFCAIVCKEGRGKLGWVRSTEKMWNHEFDRGDRVDTAPASAPLGMSFYAEEQEEPQPKSEWVQCLERSARLNLGTRLQSAGTLTSAIVIPVGACALHVLPPAPRPHASESNACKAPTPTPAYCCSGALRAALTETKEPENGELSSIDTSNTARELVKYLACQHKYIAGDKRIATHLHNAMVGLKWRPKNNKKWYGVIKNALKHARSKTGRVRASDPPSLPSSLLTSLALRTLVS